MVFHLLHLTGTSNGILPTNLSWAHKNQLQLDFDLQKSLKNITLPETNIAPKNGWLEYYFPIGEAYFQGLC